LDIPVDLSRILFVCTANVTDSIPGPLLDRMEVIRIAGYVFEEKLAIANQYLIPSSIEHCGVENVEFELEKTALEKLIKDYAREAGVRELRKLLEKICRKMALSLVRASEDDDKRTRVTLDNLTKFIGQPPHSTDRLFPDITPPGVVMGLAWTAMGGSTLFVEARGRLPPGTGRYGEDLLLVGGGEGEESNAPSAGDAQNPGDTSNSEDQRRRPRGSGARMKVTGQLGKVMGESSEISLTYAREFVRQVELENCFLEEALLHVNVPEGGVPKEGPSAGVTMTTALVSLAMDRPVRENLAMSGELTLTGKVLRVGGIKEKTIAARRERVEEILLPMGNHADYADLKPHLRAGLTAHFVDHYDDIYRLAFEGSPELQGPSRGSPIITLATPSLEQLQAEGLAGGPLAGGPASSSSKETPAGGVAGRAA